MSAMSAPVLQCQPDIWRSMHAVMHGRTRCCIGMTANMHDDHLLAADYHERERFPRTMWCG